MVDSVNGIGAGNYFSDAVAGIDTKFDVNKDGKVDMTDYQVATELLSSEDTASTVAFTKADLDTAFENLIGTEENEIDETKANELAEALVKEVTLDENNPSTAETFNDLQKIGASLTKFIKRCADISKILDEQAAELNAKMEELEEEKAQKNEEYKQKENLVNSKKDEMSEKLAQAARKSDATAEEVEKNTKATIDKVVEDYKNGEYPDKNLSEVIAAQLGSTEGIDTAAVDAIFDEASTIGAEIKAICSEIESIVADIRDVTQRYNETNDLRNTTVNNKTAVLEASQQASVQYQNGYTVRQEMREAMIEKYSADTQEEQLEKLNEFIDSGEMDNMPYADVYQVMKGAFTNCGLTFNGDSIHLGTTASAAASGDPMAVTHTKLQTELTKRYGSGATGTGDSDTDSDGEGYEDTSSPSSCVTSRETPPPSSSSSSSSCDPISFENGNIKYEFITDKNGNGTFDNAQEFLGAEDGWNEMIAHDDNGDGIIAGDELDDMQLVAIDQTTGKFNFVSAKEAGIDSINLADYEAKNETLINNDVLAGTFKVKMTDGEVIDGTQTYDTQQNLNNKYGNIFGTEIKDMTESYENKAAMEEFVETTNTKQLISKTASSKQVTADLAYSKVSAAWASANEKISEESSQAVKDKKKADDKLAEEKKLAEVGANNSNDVSKTSGAKQEDNNIKKIWF